ncbi:MAG: outer membrane protein assembly factor BamC, partial [Methylibium sp.]|nr:outer membrane protein assembly factor BamC [Methylibium sp.]
EEQAKAAEAAAAAASAAPVPPAARARLLAGSGTGLQVDEGFDRAWRRVGLALDRSGFTVEDRDRAQGLYYVRYVDQAQAGKDEPGFFSKLFGGGKKDAATQGGLARYRIAVKSQADSTLVTVLNNQGASETGDAAQRILELLATDLK